MIREKCIQGGEVFPEPCMHRERAATCRLDVSRLVGTCASHFFSADPPSASNERESTADLAAGGETIMGERASARKKLPSSGLVHALGVRGAELEW